MTNHPTDNTKSAPMAPTENLTSGTSFPHTFPQDDTQSFPQVFHKFISELGPFTEKEEKDSHGHTRTLFFRGEHVFLVFNPATLELRSDDKLAKHLIAKYESVMESRYFGRGGIEIVPAGQLTTDELMDLIRLSYNLTSD